MAEPDDISSRLARIEARLDALFAEARETRLEMTGIALAVQALFRDVQVVDDGEPIDASTDPALAALLGLGKREPPTPG